MNKRIGTLAASAVLVAGLGMAGTASADEVPDTCAAAYVSAVHAANAQWREARVAAHETFHATQGPRKAAAKAKVQTIKAALQARKTAVRDARVALKACVAAEDPVTDPVTEPTS